MIDRFDKFSALIFEVSKHWHKITSDELAKYDLKGTYAVYLSAMCNNPDGITAASLAQICCRDKADVSRAITSMEEKGMITKLSANNNSYRAAIKLTDKGFKIACNIRERCEAAVGMAGMGISDAERSVFYKTLEIIAGNLRHMSNCGVPEEPVMIKAVLFDLDGTLLPMDQEEFMKVYFGGICEHLAPMGYKSEELMNAIWNGTRAMYKNKGDVTNEEAFWKSFKKSFPNMTDKEVEMLDSFYEEKFDRVTSVLTANPDAKRAVEDIRAMGLRVNLATNPLFPRVATEKRIKWAGFEESDFEFFTSFEDARCTKPNPEFYRGVCERMGLRPCECLMVGNDVDEDMVARELGMKVFLLTDNLINRHNRDISDYPHGGYKELMKYIKEQA